MLRTLLSLLLFAFAAPAVGLAQDDVASGKLVHIDGRTRSITLSDGSTYVVSKHVKLSSREIGELVLVSYRDSAAGREAVKIRPAPQLPQHAAFDRYGAVTIDTGR